MVTFEMLVVVVTSTFSGDGAIKVKLDLNCGARIEINCLVYTFPSHSVMSLIFIRIGGTALYLSPACSRAQSAHKREPLFQIPLKLALRNKSSQLASRNCIFKHALDEQR